MAFIRLKGLSHHNLKALDLDLPIGALIVVTGPSGAGKSTLAFDTLYAEAQRRYVETFSPYARQFLERLPRPPAEAIENLPAAIAITQSNPVRSARSTVGTLADLTYPTRYLFLRMSELVCPGCGQAVRDEGPEDVLRLLQEAADAGMQGAALITAEVPADTVQEVIGQGYFRGLVDGAVRDLSEPGWGEGRGGRIEMVIDRIPLGYLDRSRAQDSAEQAFALGGGKLAVHLPDGSRHVMSRGRHCARCDRAFPKPSPNLFSFNSPTGACPTCQGFGRVLSVDWDLVIPDPHLSIVDGAIRPLENWQDEKEDLLVWCRRHKVDPRTPWGELPEKIRNQILFGDGAAWPGIKAFFDFLETKRYKTHVRILLSRYRAYLECPTCHGGRFREVVGWYRLGGMSISDFYALSVTEASAFVETLAGQAGRDTASLHLLEDLQSKLLTLDKAGLGYLSLDRQSRTLSGGEVGRVSLARALGTRLTQTLYILDEPTGGLHPVDRVRLLDLLRSLRDRGNTVIVVEHDPLFTQAGDVLVVLGPGSGEEGGRLVYAGPPGKGPRPLAASMPSVGPPPSAAAAEPQYLRVLAARAHNLQGITVDLPLGRMTCVTGVSGSGKSSLVETVLYRSLLRHKGLATDPPGEHGGLEGADLVDSVHLVDQSPVGRSPRACPASYLHALDGIRRLFAGTADAKALELAAGAFSFNTEGGRCELCKGQGSEIVEMQFLPDLTLPCPACRGRRFKQEVLSVRYRGQTIDDVLRMTLVEASAFFERHAGVVRPLEPAIALGLGHLRMGQPINTLSGGEAQRLKLAKYLLVGESGRALFLLDEPSRGLHPPEVARLLSALASLKAAGHTLVLVEHNLDVIQAADWVVDLGPGPGPEGGRLVYQGPLAGLAGVEASRTGLAVRGLAGRTEPSVPAAAPPPETFEDIIRIQGARHHNLQDLSLDIPRGRFVVVTGVSGSGKSSLAFDILFVEGQRRYIEGLSSYMRQFIRLYERPEVDNVEGLTPTVAIEQRTSRADSRSTVATLTEVAHYLRVLFARVAIPHCPGCGRRLEAGSRREILEEIGRRWRNQDVRMLAPRVKRRKGWHQPVLEAAHRAGLGEVRIDGEFYDIPPYPGLSRYREHTIEWVFGPVRMDPASPGVADLFERAMTAGKGAITVVGEGGEEAFYSEHYICPDCGVSLADPDPLLFSFHTAAGMCPRCQGQGRLASGRTCPECQGVRLNAEARAWRIGGVGLDTLLAKEVEEARSVMDAWRGGPPWADRLNRVGIPLVREVAERLAFLEEVGLGYLPLDRAGNTLSGGEAQRIRLAAQMGSGLTGLTLVLDEPTIGLHPRDNARLLRVLTALKAQGHTVVVVEHDEATLRAADWIVDLGPGGGKYGGRIVAEGTLQDIMATPESQTGAALADESRHRLVGGPGSEPEALVRLRGIRHRNLSGVDLDFPVGRFIGVCGVSGSGKSTLVSDVLSPGVEARLRDPSAPVSHCDELTGVEAFKRHVIVDHSPIGRTPRSCPATYVGLMGDLRALLAQTPAARSRGYGPERFSFNVEGGRCPACKGQGVQKVSLGFLPDSYVLCEDCQGNRFESGTLEITWKGLNIARILSLTMEEASEVFASIPVLARPLGVLCDLGLGYLTLGQASPTLSGGEAQRLKLARDLVHQNRPSTLYLLDEPTTGLHMRDVERLVAHLRKLVALGHTVMVVEHNLDVLCQTDWVIELGPGGGRHGGHILFSGPLKRFVDEAGPTPTRSALLDHLGRP